MLTNAQARRRAQVLQAQREARSKMYSDLRLGRTVNTFFFRFLLYFILFF